MELTLEQALQKGVEAHKAGKVEEADRYYTAVLKAQPKHPDANHNTGVLAVGVGKVQGALPFFRTALEANPSIAQYWLSYIDALIKIDRINDAQAVLNEAKSKGAKGDGFDKLEKKLKGTKKSKSKVSKSCEPLRKQVQPLINLYTQGQYQKALNLASQLLLKFPNSINVHNIIGATNTELGRLEEAIEAYKNAIIIKPDFAETYNNMGNALIAQGKFQEAIEAFEKALSIKPELSEAYNNIGTALRNQEQLENAIEAYEKALSINPDFVDAQYNIGNILTEQGNLEEAIKSYNKVLSKKPGHAEAYHGIGNILQRQGRHEQAFEAYKRASSIKPSFPEAYNNMGNALKVQGKHYEAIQYYKKAIKIKDDYLDAWVNLGLVFKEQGELNESVEACKKAISIKPDYAETYNIIGNVFRKQGKPEEAMESYKRALSINPHFVEAYNNMGNVLREQGQIENAIKSFKKAVAIKPDAADVLENYLSLATQLTHTAVIEKDNFYISNGSNSKLTKGPKFQILKAIQSFLNAEKELVNKYVNSFNSCDSKLLNSLTPNDEVFCSAYSRFLSKLIISPFSWTNVENSGHLIYHLGESHCLSYAHHTIKIKDTSYQILPKITFGAKAFHFSSSIGNGYKAITKAHFEVIPMGSKLFLSFGEIDCRPNEGFIPAATKLNRPIEDIISGTVKEFLNWFAKQNQNKSHSLYFCNVPAPIYNQKYTAELNNRVISTIKLFNNNLKKTISEYDFNIIDVFKFTVGNGGFSNGLFHIDDYHLSSDAIPEIEKQIGA